MATLSHIPATLVQESNRLLQHTWRSFVRQMPAGATTRAPGRLIANGKSALPFMNMVIPRSPVTDETDLRARIDLAASHFRKDCVQWPVYRRMGYADTIRFDAFAGA